VNNVAVLSCFNCPYKPFDWMYQFVFTSFCNYPVYSTH